DSLSELLAKRMAAVLDRSAAYLAWLLAARTMGLTAIAFEQGVADRARWKETHVRALSRAARPACLAMRNAHGSSSMTASTSASSASTSCLMSAMASTT